MNKLKKNKPELLSFLIPIAMMVFVIAVYGFYPLSNSVMAPYDTKHQYIPFLAEYKAKLISGELFGPGILYSWRMAGTDFYLNWMYYLTSPFNVLTIFFKDMYLCFQVIFTIKLGVIGLSMSYYLKKSKNIDTGYRFVFATAFSLSAYTMTYFFSIMWLDVLMLFPWIIYWFEKAYGYGNDCKNRMRARIIYSLLLAAIIYSNFFMAMHVCIFLCIYFLLTEHDKLPGKFGGIRGFFKDGILFGFHSLIGGGISAMFFLPFIQLLGDKQSDAPTMTFLGGFEEMFSSFGVGAARNVALSYGGMPNLFCGVITLCLFFGFLANKKQPAMKRMKYGIVVLFLFLCMWIKWLDWFMNGFYMPAGYMGRYSYILIFFLIIGAYECFLDIRANKERTYNEYILFFPGILFASTYILILMSGDDNVQAKISTGVSAFICLAAANVISPTYKRIENKSKQILCGFLMIEVIFTSMLDVCVADVTHLINGEEAIDYFSTKYDIDDGRIAVLPHESHNTELLYGHNGIGLFTSSLSSDVFKYYSSMGFRSGSNYATAMGIDTLPSLLYNIKYIFDDRDNVIHPGFEKKAYEYGYSVWENKYDTYYAYKVPKKILELPLETNNPFGSINRFAACFTGGNDKLFDEIPDSKLLVDTDYHSVKTSHNGMFYIDFQKDKDDDDEDEDIPVGEVVADNDSQKTIGSYIEIGAVAERDNMYINLRNGRFSSWTVYINNEVFLSGKDSDDTMVIPAKAGDKVSIKVKTKKDEGHFTVGFAYLNEDVFDEFAKAFSEAGIDIQYGKNIISGSAEIDDDEMIIISVPNIDGWSKTKGDGVFTVYPLLSFTHDSGEFVLEYNTPYLKEGIYITAICILIIAGLLIIQRKKK